MNQQEYFMKMQMLGQEAEKIEQQMQSIDQQMAELNAVRESIEAIKNGKQKDILANLGKGIFIKAEISDTNLFLNIGKETIIKKSSDETIKVIEDQITKLLAGKEQYMAQIGELQESMQNLLIQAQKENDAASPEGHAHEHEHSCDDCHGDCDCEEPCDDCKCK